MIEPEAVAAMLRPKELGREFCTHALKLTAPVIGFVAMLLRCDFDQDGESPA